MHSPGLIVCLRRLTALLSPGHAEHSALLQSRLERIWILTKNSRSSSSKDGAALAALFSSPINFVIPSGAADRDPTGAPLRLMGVVERRTRGTCWSLKVAGSCQKSLPSLKGLYSLITRYPALKRWAILFRACGALPWRCDVSRAVPTGGIPAIPV